MNADTVSQLADVVQPGGRRCLMVVDGSEESRAAIADYFQARGWEVLVACTGVEAIARTITRRVDVVLMNATLPGLEGYEAAAILRKLDPRVRVILLVEAAFEARPRESQRMERFRFFPKPLNLQVVAHAIEAEEAEPTGETERNTERNVEDAG